MTRPDDSRAPFFLSATLAERFGQARISHSCLRFGMKAIIMFSCRWRHNVGFQAAFGQRFLS